MFVLLPHNHRQQKAIPVLHTKSSVVAEKRLSARRASNASLPPIRTEATSRRGIPIVAVTAM